MRISGLTLTLAVLAVVSAGCGQEGGDTTASDDAGASSTTSTTSTPSTDASSPTEEPPPLTGTDVHWGYTGDIGPASWGGLSADYATCAEGVEQSPIDLHTGGKAGAGEGLELDYGDITEHLVNNGHAIQLVNDEVESPDDDELDDHLEVDGVDYELQQFHFHAPSEHTVDGVPSPVEFHFVHADADGNLAVLGVLVRESPDGEDNPAWAPFVEAASTPDDLDVPAHLDISTLLPTGAGALEHWTYDGSLTTPPCSEGVRWLVLDHPIDLSTAQVDALQGVYVDNNRPVQPLGDRSVSLLAD